jgi:hypothetical protein
MEFTHRLPKPRSLQMTFPYCSITYCPRRLDCQTETWLQQMILLESEDLKQMQNHCQHIVLQHKNPNHKDVFAEELNILTPLELLQRYKKE